MPPGTLPAAKVEVQATKPNWKAMTATPVKVVAAGVDAQGNKLFQAAQNFTLNRAATPAFWIAALILLGVYVVISFEWMHRTLAAFWARPSSCSSPISWGPWTNRFISSPLTTPWGRST